uniref:Si:dkey-191g9.7 n=1 Tax=Oryzias latipes TaxID=8090 RepID=A0A3P9JD91_ORYLA
MKMNNANDDGDSKPMLACKQPMQVQHYNMVTTVCGAACCKEAHAFQPHIRCTCTPSTEISVKVKCPKLDGDIYTKELHCLYCNRHHSIFEETFAACCHPQPIPTPSQLSPQMAKNEPCLKVQRALTPPPTATHLTPPPLISSVSETDLNCKFQMHCCNSKCNWLRSLSPCQETQPPKQLNWQEGCNQSLVKVTKHDVGTMTIQRVLKNAGVQTLQTSSHGFPQLSVANERKNKFFNSLNSNKDERVGNTKSPVKDVKWDAEGMTWEVYGASVDPEELGLAIQRHLELQIKETASRVTKLMRQNINTSQQSMNVSSNRKNSRMTAPFRRMTCCSYSTAVND